MHASVTHNKIQHSGFSGIFAAPGIQVEILHNQIYASKIAAVELGGTCHSLLPSATVKPSHVAYNTMTCCNVVCFKWFRNKT